MKTGGYNKLRKFEPQKVKGKRTFRSGAHLHEKIVHCRMFPKPWMIFYYQRRPTHIFFALSVHLLHHFHLKNLMRHARVIKHEMFPKLNFFVGQKTRGGRREDVARSITVKVVKTPRNFSQTHPGSGYRMGTAGPTQDFVFFVSAVLART